MSGNLRAHWRREWKVYQKERSYEKDISFRDFVKKIFGIEIRQDLSKDSERVSLQ